MRLFAGAALGFGAIHLLRPSLEAPSRFAASAALFGYAVAPLLGAAVAGLAGANLWLRSRPRLTFAPQRWILAGLAFGIACGWVAVVAMGIEQQSHGFRAHLYRFGWERQVLSFRPSAVLVVALAAGLNALSEEWLFRRLILQHLESVGLSSLLAVVVSSLSFGAAHIRSGLPGGLIGFFLTATFGAAMGTAYVAQPDPRPFILSAHFAADLMLIWRALSL